MDGIENKGFPSEGYFIEIGMSEEYAKKLSKGIQRDFDEAMKKSMENIHKDFFDRLNG